MTTTTIDTGGHVYHEPTGEEWLVARVDGSKLAWCGWPQGWGNVSDCTLIKNATADQRLNLLRQLAEGQSMHAGWAKETLAKEGHVA